MVTGLRCPGRQSAPAAMPGERPTQDLNSPTTPARESKRVGYRIFSASSP